MLTGLVETFQSKKFSENLQITLLNMKEFRRWMVRVDTASSQQVAAVLEARLDSRKTGELTNIFV